MRRYIPILAAVALVVGGCSAPTPAPGTHVDSPAQTAAAESPGATMLDDPAAAAIGDAPAGAQPHLAADPVQLADDLVADEQALRDPSTSEPASEAAARRQQAAYRAIGRHLDWDAVVRPRIPAELVATYDRNVDARRQLTAMTPPKDTVPPWTIVAPAPADELLNDYHEADAATGVSWNYLAAINLVETRLGSINGISSAGAQGPMQFLPGVFATYGQGGDINAPHDSIMAAGRFLAANGFASNPDHAVYGYNHADEYVRAVSDYAAILAADPAAFAGFYRWDVYYNTTAGDVLLPIGYSASAPTPVGDYLAGHPQ